MNLLDLTLPTLGENLALDEALLLQAEAGGPEVLRFWEWRRHAVVLGAGGKLAEEVNIDACRAAEVPITRRSSGGGTVLLGPGCLLFSLILAFDRAPELREIRSSYAYILTRIADAFSVLAIHVAQAGISDLTLAKRKVSGNSQQRKRTHLLHHGTLLYDFDLAQIERFLPLPSRRPEYRSDRPHGDFVANLPVSPVDLRQRLIEAWQAYVPLHDVPTVQNLLDEKFTSHAWLHRR